jgi:predicted  nucleic acid-binding Zn-ribbon protein
MINNFADISVFENLQNETHRRMGISSLSVFNATFKVIDKKKVEANKQNVENWKKLFIETEKDLIKTKIELEQKRKDSEKEKIALRKKEKEFEKIKKEKELLQQNYNSANRRFEELKSKRSSNRVNMRHAIKTFVDWGIHAATIVDLDKDD